MVIWRPLFFYLLAAVVCRKGSGSNDDLISTQPRIVGGKPATKKYPYLGFPAGSTLCGATLIHTDVLLTAAHCDDAFDMGVLLGGHKIDGSDSYYHQCDKRYKHSDYKGGTNPHDIMLVRLQQKSSAAPVKLATDERYPVQGATMTLLGWGATSETGDISDDLLTADVKVTNLTACAKYYGIPHHESVFCAAWPDDWSRDSCQGDSGGPILNQEGTQMGIVSYGNGCARQQVSSVYTKVSYYRDWIQKGICDISNYPPASCGNLAPQAALTPFPTPVPTKSPTTRAPVQPPPPPPTRAPVQPPPPPPSNQPTRAPVQPPPSKQPTKAPTKAPSKAPTKAPTPFPTQVPLATPTKRPSGSPTLSPPMPKIPSSGEQSQEEPEGHATLPAEQLGMPPTIAPAASLNATASQSVNSTEIETTRPLNQSTTNATLVNDSLEDSVTSIPPLAEGQDDPGPTTSSACKGWTSAVLVFSVAKVTLY